MTTFQQFVRNKKHLSKSSKTNYNRSPKLNKCPQRRGILVRIYTSVPKKPNSAVRKIVKLRLSTGSYIRAAVSGQGHSLQEHATVLVKANRVRDMPGVHYRLIRGARDFNSAERHDDSKPRTTSRSKYGIKRLTKEEFMHKSTISAKSIEIFAKKMPAAELKAILDKK